jgi:hypothetical protein
MASLVNVKIISSYFINSIFDTCVSQSSNGLIDFRYNIKEKYKNKIGDISILNSPNFDFLRCVGYYDKDGNKFYRECKASELEYFIIKDIIYQIYFSKGFNITGLGNSKGTYQFTPQDIVIPYTSFKLPDGKEVSVSAGLFNTIVILRDSYGNVMAELKDYDILDGLLKYLR